MLFTETELNGAFIIDPERVSDDRGFFARSFCSEEFREHGLVADFVQCNISHNVREGTLRGMHWQEEPHGEVKLVRCTLGAIFDVIVDIRPDSPTHRRWISVELTSENRRMIYIPRGFAHGFQTLVDNTEVFYQMSERYHQESARGARWNDPAFGILWPPTEARVISTRDQTHGDYLR